MTQALTFIYNPNEEETTRNGFTEDEYGNGPYFQMWSGYRNWLPGSAVVGDDTTRTAPGGRTFRSGYVDTPCFYQTWNGNFLDVGVFTFDAGISDRLRSVSLLAQGATGAVLSPTTMSNIRTEFSNNIMNAQISNDLLSPTAIDFNTPLAMSFMQHIPLYRAEWGGQTMSRTKNFSWRIVPTVYEDTTVTNPWFSTNNNAIKLEIMFNEPIMHTAHTFNETMFGTTVNNPYKYLTLSGQGIIRYGKTRIFNADVVDPFGES
jgi:hypothetical protein